MCQSANRKSAIFSLNPEIANPQMSLLSQSANLQIGKLFTIEERGWNTSSQKSSSLSAISWQKKLKFGCRIVIFNYNGIFLTIAFSAFMCQGKN
jgi:hypothetical protein